MPPILATSAPRPERVLGTGRVGVDQETGVDPDGNSAPAIRLPQAMRNPSGKRTSRKAIILVVQIALLAGIAAPAAALEAREGGLPIPDPPRISDVICLTDCRGLRSASVGSLVQVSGRDMGGVREVSFAIAGGRTRVEAERTTETSATAIVPPKARSGPVRVVSTGGIVSGNSTERLAIGRKPSPGSGSVRLVDAGTSPRRAYLFGARKPTLSFVVGGISAPTDLRLDLVDSESAVVFSTFMRQVAPNQSVRYRWNGRDSSGRPARAGRYSFRVSTADGSPLPAPTQREESLGFSLLGFVFPVPAPHSYGDGIGAGRNHQGVDVLAACGKPLLAARGGRVYWNAFQAEGAGHYIVINLAGTKRQSHVYMHLTKPSPFKKGAWVKTGQRIGSVGTTGRSTACHLHFEHWSSPGWYQGGTFIDPMARLRKWDRYS